MSPKPKHDPVQLLGLDPTRLLAARLTAIRLAAGVSAPPARPLFRVVRKQASRADRVALARQTMAALRARHAQ